MPPTCFIFCGNFSSAPYGKNHIKSLKGEDRNQKAKTKRRCPGKIFITHIRDTYVSSRKCKVINIIIIIYILKAFIYTVQCL